MPAGKGTCVDAEAIFSELDLVANAMSVDDHLFERYRRVEKFLPDAEQIGFRLPLSSQQ